MKSITLSALLLSLFLANEANAGFPETERSANADRLMLIAEQGMRDGDKACAAEAYELILAQRPGDSRVLAPVLARLHAELGNTTNALHWAEKVKSFNPRPSEYMAGVHTLLGQYDAAEKLLDPVCAGTNGPIVAAACVQLADVCEKKGNHAKARAALEKAARLSEGRATSKDIARLITAFDKRHPPTNESDPRRSQTAP